MVCEVAAQGLVDGDGEGGSGGVDPRAADVNCGLVDAGEEAVGKEGCGGKTRCEMERPEWEAHG